jgi:hypothetical protein
VLKSRIELKLTRRDSTIESMWRTPGGEWNKLADTTVPWVTLLRGGLILNSRHAASSDGVADFDSYAFCGSTVTVKNQLLPIIAKRPTSGIRGRLLQNGAPLGPVAVELRRNRPAVDAPSELVTLAGSNPDGYFAFEYPNPQPLHRGPM